MLILGIGLAVAILLSAAFSAAELAVFLPGEARVRALADQKIAGAAALVQLRSKPERTLVLGYSANVQSMLDDLAGYVASGSSVTLVADVDVPMLEVPAGLTVQTRRADTSSRIVLETLGVQDYDHVLVLAYRDDLDVQAADAKTLVTLLHLRDIADRDGFSISIVSEMLDDRNRELAEVTRPDDFIVSDRLASLMIAQVSESRALISVFEQLFSSGGNEVYLRPAELYVDPGAEVDFYTVVGAAARKQETAIGFEWLATCMHATGDTAST